MLVAQEMQAALSNDNASSVDAHSVRKDAWMFSALALGLFTEVPIDMYFAKDGSSTSSPVATSPTKQRSPNNTYEAVSGGKLINTSLTLSMSTTSVSRLDAVSKGIHCTIILIFTTVSNWLY
jgi:hypothetical protein